MDSWRLWIPGDCGFLEIGDSWRLWIPGDCGLPKKSFIKTSYKDFAKVNFLRSVMCHETGVRSQKHKTSSQTHKLKVHIIFNPLDANDSDPKLFIVHVRCDASRSKPSADDED